MTEFRPRSISEIQQTFFQFIREQNTLLTDTSQGSGIYTLGRSIAAIFAEQDLNLFSLSSSFYLSSARGEDLDRLAANYGVTRRPGGFARGYALATAFEGNFTLSPSSVFTEPSTALQFLVPSTTNSRITGVSESRIPLIATKQGSEYNLPAGTRLILPGLERASFVVGSHRTSSGEICGDMTSGAAPEGDEPLRERVINTLVNNRATTENALKSAILADPSVSWVSITTPISGYVEVWIDSTSRFSASDIDRLRRIASSHVAAGILVDVKQAERQTLDINVFIVPRSGADLDTLSSQVIGTAQNYLLSLQLGQKIIRKDLLNAIQNISNVLQASIITPSTDVEPSGAQVILRSSNIWVTFDVD